MAALPGMGTPISVVAAEDLSTYQWNVVKLNTSGQAEHMDAITDIPFGVLQNAPASGEVASVIPIGCGLSRIELGGTLNPGVRVSSAADGAAVAAAATAYPIGVLLEGGADTEIGIVNLVSLTVMA